MPLQEPFCGLKASLLPPLSWLRAHRMWQQEIGSFFAFLLSPTPLLVYLLFVTWGVIKEEKSVKIK